MGTCLPIILIHPIVQRNLPPEDNCLYIKCTQKGLWKWHKDFRC